MGPPGAGKGTQAAVVAEHFSIPAISTGDIFRTNVSQGTELGLKAKQYMDAGEYVPDAVTNLMVRNRIDESDARPGFLLDGYPRTVAQVEELDKMIGFTGHRLDAVVVLTVEGEELIGRLLQRAQTEPVLVEERHRVDRADERDRCQEHDAVGNREKPIGQQSQVQQGIAVAQLHDDHRRQ